MSAGQTRSSVSVLQYKVGGCRWPHFHREREIVSLCVSARVHDLFPPDAQPLKLVCTFFSRFPSVLLQNVEIYFWNPTNPLGFAIKWSAVVLIGLETEIPRHSLAQTENTFMMVWAGRPQGLHGFCPHISSTTSRVSHSAHKREGRSFQQWVN